MRRFFRVVFWGAVFMWFGALVFKPALLPASLVPSVLRPYVASRLRPTPTADSPAFTPQATLQETSAPLGSGTPLDSEAQQLAPTPRKLAAATDTPRVPANPNAPLARPVAASPDFQPLPLRLPSPPARQALQPDSRILTLQAKNQKLPTYAAYRQLVSLYLARGEYTAAVQALRTQAAMFRKAGLSDAAIIQDTYANRYTTDARLFVERAPTPSDIRRLSSGAPGEPAVGCYAGAFIDRDDGLGESFFDEGWQSHHAPDVWRRLTRKPHSSLWMYHAYGRPAPMSWLRLCRDKGIVPHIAWEPKSMTQVNDDAYLRGFARQLRSLNWPVLLRFASEMNGNWTPYHNNPQLYRQKFRLFTQVIHREAPNAAVVWCVANPPLDNIDQYYPGDDGCDWVGVNFYAVPFYENNPNRPALEDNPLALLDAVYRKYAARKPIAICEFGASFQAGMDKIVRPSFAQEKMSLIYGALPLLYPRVKLMDWFSMNTIRYSTPGKTASNYALSENQPVLQTYRALVSPSWFLTQAPDEENDDLPPVSVPLTANTALRGTARLHIWVKTYTPRPAVYLVAGNRVVYAARRYGPHTIDLDAARLPAGTTALTLHVYDDHNRFITSQSVPVQMGR